MFYLTSKHFTPHAQTFYTPHPTPEHFRTHTHFTPKYFAPRTLLPNTLHHTPKHFTPHTLQPNTVHLMPYTQTLYTPHLTPHTLHPNTVHLMPYTRTLYTSHPTPYTQSLHTPHFTPNYFTSHILQPNTAHLTPKQTHYTPHWPLPLSCVGPLACAAAPWAPARTWRWGQPACRRWWGSSRWGPPRSRPRSCRGCRGAAVGSKGSWPACGCCCSTPAAGPPPAAGQSPPPPRGRLPSPSAAPLLPRMEGTMKSS